MSSKFERVRITYYNSGPKEGELKCPRASFVAKDKGTVTYKDQVGRLYYFNEKMKLSSNYIEDHELPSSGIFMLCRTFSDDEDGADTVPAEGSVLYMIKQKSKSQQRYAPERIKVSIEYVLDSGINQRSVVPCLVIPFGSEDWDKWKLFRRHGKE